MSFDDMPLAAPRALRRRLSLARRPRRPWLLIAAALLLARLATILWAKWRETRLRAEQLQAELRQVYMEAESLRTQATRAQQRVGQLEQELRALGQGKGASPSGVRRP